jgi:predicted DsbA family dithiol-disulfide isomerase
LAQEYDVEIEWVPFELHPEIPPEGRPRDEVLPAAYLARAEEGVNRLATSVGLHLKLHERLINSRPALQAAEFAREQGRFDAMHHSCCARTGMRVGMSRTSLSFVMSPHGRVST